MDPDTATDHDPLTGQDEGDTGAYLYAIGLATTVADQAGLDQMLEGAGLRSLRHGDLVAFVRSAPLDEFTEERIQERIQDQEWLMYAVQHHHQTIADLSGQLAVLPSTFGAVYESEDAVLESLAQQEDALSDQLRRVAGCDEWALHIYREESGIRERVLEADPELQRMNEELESAPAGRAYLLKQQITKRLSQAIEEQQLAIADEVLDRVEGYVRDLRVEEPRDSGASEEGDTEIARASLLVARELSEEMLDALSAAAESTPGIRVEVSGPWPVYSFAIPKSEAS